MSHDSGSRQGLEHVHLTSDRRFRSVTAEFEALTRGDVLAAWFANGIYQRLGAAGKELGAYLVAIARENTHSNYVTVTMPEDEDLRTTLGFGVRGPYTGRKELELAGVLRPDPDMTRHRSWRLFPTPHEEPTDDHQRSLFEAEDGDDGPRPGADGDDAAAADPRPGAGGPADEIRAGARARGRAGAHPRAGAARNPGVPRPGADSHQQESAPPRAGADFCAPHIGSAGTRAPSPRARGSTESEYPARALSPTPTRTRCEGVRAEDSDSALADQQQRRRGKARWGLACHELWGQGGDCNDAQRAADETCTYALFDDLVWPIELDAEAGASRLGVAFQIGRRARGKSSPMAWLTKVLRRELDNAVPLGPGGSGPAGTRAPPGKENDAGRG